MALRKKRNVITRLAARFRENGLPDAALRLEEVAQALEEQWEAQSWLERNADRVRAMFTRHVENASLEIDETTQLLQVARRLLVERKAVSKDEKDQARQQLVDLLKFVPASAIFAGTMLIPLPGAQPILLPLLMERLGLLPSAWGESRLEANLRDLASIAEHEKLPDVAAALLELRQGAQEHGTRVSELNQYIRDNPDWSVFFDEDFDNHISSQELGRLQQRIRETAREAARDSESEEWSVYFRGDEGSDKIRGFLTFNEVRMAFPDGRNALVRKGEQSWWVPLWAVLREMG